MLPLRFRLVLDEFMEALESCLAPLQLLKLGEFLVFSQDYSNEHLARHGIIRVNLGESLSQVAFVQAFVTVRLVRRKIHVWELLFLV